jgi:hypothetical protein
MSTSANIIQYMRQRYATIENHGLFYHSSYVAVLSIHENSRFRLRSISYCVPIHGKTKTTSSTVIWVIHLKGDGLQAQQKTCKCWWVTWKSSFDILANGYPAWRGMRSFQEAQNETHPTHILIPRISAICSTFPILKFLAMVEYHHVHVMATFCWTNGTMFAGEISIA